SLTCRIEGQEYMDDFGQALPYKRFYDYMRNGFIPKTSQPSVNAYYDVFSKYAKEGFDVLYICTSSGLSGAYNSAYIAKKMLQDEYPDTEVYIFDALTACLGQGLMTMKALELKEKGESMENIVDYLETNVQQYNTFMIVNDLNHLKRGGRISAAAAAIGKVLSINPVLSISESGSVLLISKIRGRKKAINKLAEIMFERIETPEQQTIAISHGDCLEEAMELKRIILDKLNVKSVYMNYIGPVVGTYGGPGAMAVFFMGKDRKEVVSES
ncbi:MAG: DegV family protein, partial [Solirubrobacterales bacterium]